MRKEDITIMSGSQTAVIPNSWQGVTPDVFQKFVSNLAEHYAGNITVADIRRRYVLDVMGWRLSRIHDADALATVISIADRVTFLFTVPDSSAAGQPSLTPNLNFFAQFVPTIKIGTTEYHAYTVSTAYNSLTTSLTALQFIEAQQILQQPQSRIATVPGSFAAGQSSLPFLAAILYCPPPYNSTTAQLLADKMQQLSPVTLMAIQMNFIAFTTALYSQTEFALLAKFQPKKQSPIATDMADALYDLCADGLGTHEEVEQMNLLTYLRILRKKTIEAVRQMRSMEWDVIRISQETTLPVSVIQQIID